MSADTIFTVHYNCVYLVDIVHGDHVYHVNKHISDCDCG
jgi:hypothetical protein